MTELSPLGKMLILIGFFLIVLGIGITFLGKISILRLPGDIVVKKPNLIFYFPIVSSIILSLILTLILNLFFRR
jgi:uncharacterized membrane protein